MRPESTAPQSPSLAQPQRSAPEGSRTQAVPSRLMAQAADAEPGAQATQRLLSASHAGVVPMHAAVLAAVHCTQRPVSRPAVAHAGVGAWQSIAVAQGRQVRVVVSHTGAAPEQSASLAQPTQRLVPPSQTPVRQSALTTHCTQRPALAPVVAQALAPGSAQSVEAVAVAQGRHACVVASQAGRAGSTQSRLPAHATQVLVARSQRGVGEVQCVSLVQATQRPEFAPLEAQAGRVASMAAHCASEAQATQVREARSHTGAAGERVQSLVALQRHTPAARSHTGAVSGQLRSGAPGIDASVRPDAVSRMSGRQSLSESVSR